MAHGPVRHSFPQVSPNLDGNLLIFVTVGRYQHQIISKYLLRTMYIIVHFYCDTEPLLSLACWGKLSTEILDLMVSVLIIWVFFHVVSYTCIISKILLVLSLFSLTRRHSLTVASIFHSSHFPRIFQDSDIVLHTILPTSDLTVLLTLA